MRGYSSVPTREEMREIISALKSTEKTLKQALRKILRLHPHNAMVRRIVCQAFTNTLANKSSLSAIKSNGFIQEGMKCPTNTTAMETSRNTQTLEGKEETGKQPIVERQDSISKTNVKNAPEQKGLQSTILSL